MRPKIRAVRIIQDALTQAVRDSVALSLVGAVGPEALRSLLASFGGATEALWATEAEMARHTDVSESVKASIVALRESVVRQADEQLARAEAEGDRILCFGQSGYPHRLSLCPDAPTVLYVRGSVDLDATKVIAVVGTRRPTDAGTALTGELVGDLCERHPDLLVLSGLALGIDIAAHGACLRKECRTAAVVAHGLHTIYPDAHRCEAAEMVAGGGGICTEYAYGVGAEAHHFLARNRIVAGLCDGLVVVESGLRGGAMSAAARAHEYSRTLMAVPGFPGRELSEGPNHLLRLGRAALVENADDVDRLLGWSLNAPLPVTPTLFGAEVDETERRLTEALRGGATLTAAALAAQTQIPVARATAALLNMQFTGRVLARPGNSFKLTDR